MESWQIVRAYKSETAGILERFRAGRITHQECLAALDAALGDLVPRLDPEQLPDVQRLIRANNDAIVAEVKRRGPLKIN